MFVRLANESVYLCTFNSTLYIFVYDYLVRLYILLFIFYLPMQYEGTKVPVRCMYVRKWDMDTIYIL